MANGNYTAIPHFSEEFGHEGDIMTVADFLESVDSTLFTDYDGSGHPMRNGRIDRSIDIYPSDKAANIPDDATHIIWYNK